MIAQLSWLYRLSAFRPRDIVLFSFRFFWVPFAGCHVFYNTTPGVPHVGTGKRDRGRNLRAAFANWYHWGPGCTWERRGALRKIILGRTLGFPPPPSSESLSMWWWPLPLEEESLTPKVRARFRTARSLLNFFLQVARIVNCLKAGLDCLCFPEKNSCIAIASIYTVLCKCP